MARTVCFIGFILFLALFPFYLPAASETVMIYAIYYDTYLSNEPDEAVALMNISLPRSRSAAGRLPIR